MRINVTTVTSAFIRTAVMQSRGEVIGASENIES